MNQFFRKIKLSLLDNDFGACIKAEDFGKSLRYLLIIMLFIGSIIMINAGIEIYSFKKDFVQKLETKFPDFELKDGRFLCSGIMPFIYNSKDEVFIIDTSGKTYKEVLNGYKSGVYISETNIEYKKSTAETRSYNLSDAKNFNFTKSKLIKVINQFTIPGLIFIFLVSVFFIFVAKLVGVLLLTIIALIINKVLKSEIDYTNIFKISIYAIVLPSIIKFGLGLAKTDIPYFFVLYYGIATFYIWRYIKGFNVIADQELKINEADGSKLTSADSRSEL